jgi:Dolichyl-phosphate-mannose-protein mannosyltransferase
MQRHVPLLLILLVAAGLRLQYITAPLLDAHRWRQVDTAAVARAFYEGPMNPLKPEANWGGAHGYVESEFPLLSLLVSVLYKLFGVSETWGRLVVVVFSLATVALVYVLARDLIDHPAGLAAAFLVAVSPGAVFYGRAFMPDTLMVCFSVGAILGFSRYLAQGSRRALLAGSASLALAVLVKLPAVIVAAPLVVMVWKQRRWAALRDRRLMAALVVPAVLSVAWYWHAYQLYRETGLTFGVFGTTKTYPPDVAPGPWITAFSKWSSWDLLTSWSFYETLISRLWLLHLTPPGLALAAIGILLLRRVPGRVIVDSWFLAMLMFMLAAGYGQMGHDYYQLPLVAICAFYFGAAARNAFDADWIASAIGPGLRWQVAVAAVLGAVASLAFVNSRVIDRHFRPESPDVRMLRAGQAIAAAAEDGALIVVVDDYGVNSPMLLYFAHARGWSLDADTARADAVRGLTSKGARYFATTRLSEVVRRQPDLALYLGSKRRVPLNQAPANTALFDLR